MALLLDGVVEEVAEECRQFFGESVVETGGIDRVVGCGFVDTSIAGDRAGFAADGKAHDERPDEHPDVDFPITDDDSRSRGLRSSVRKTAKSGENESLLRRVRPFRPLLIPTVTGSRRLAIQPLNPTSAVYSVS